MRNKFFQARLTEGVETWQDLRRLEQVETDAALQFVSSGSGRGSGRHGSSEAGAVDAQSQFVVVRCCGHKQVVKSSISAGQP